MIIPHPQAGDTTREGNTANRARHHATAKAPKRRTIIARGVACLCAWVRKEMARASTAWPRHPVAGLPSRTGWDGPRVAPVARQGLGLLCRATGRLRSTPETAPRIAFAPAKRSETRARTAGNAFEARLKPRAATRPAPVPLRAPLARSQAAAPRA